QANTAGRAHRGQERDGGAEHHGEARGHRERESDVVGDEAVGQTAHRAPPGSVATQLASSRAPTSPDFSGWNWVAESGPSSTAATNRSPPCSAQVTVGAASGPVSVSSQRRTP